MTATPWPTTARDSALARVAAPQRLLKLRRNSMNLAQTGHGIVSVLSCCTALGRFLTPSIAALYKSAAFVSLSSAERPEDSSSDVDSASA